MNNLPRKLTTVGVGVGGILAVLKYSEGTLAYIAIFGIVLLCIANMSLQYLTDNNHNLNGEIDGKVKEKIKEILHPKDN